MATLRELKGRIGSVASSEKITGAMKMISSAKMHKAQVALVRLKPFREQIQSIIGNLLSADTVFTSPLLESREVKRMGIVVFGSDDGLCGAYNINIFKALTQKIATLREKYGNDTDFIIYPIGSKMVKAVMKIAGAHVDVEVVDGVDSKSDDESIKNFTFALVDKFLAGEVDAVDLMYMHFKSMSRQTLSDESLLPVVQEALTGGAGKVQCRPYIFEPDANVIFSSVLPMYILSVMQDVFTENRASEQAARVMAMQSANDNAKKLLEQLRLEYNKLRQQSITTELLDIVGGQVR